MGNANAQSQNSYNGGNETKRIINNKKFRLLYEEVVIDASVEEVWNKVAGNFAKGEPIGASLNSIKCLSGDLVTGLGAERYLNIDFNGKVIEVKERIIDFQECGDQREFTYDVYESKGGPINIKSYNTWSVRKGEDGKTYLGNLFIFRAKYNLMTGLVGKIFKKSGALRGGLLSYKHLIETGVRKESTEKLSELYPR